MLVFDAGVGVGGNVALHTESCIASVREVVQISIAE